MRYCEVSTTCPGSTTSWKLIVKWLQACCIPVEILPSGLLLLRRPSQGDVRGWLKAPSPKRLINAGVLSLPAILLPVLSVRSIRWNKLEVYVLLIWMQSLETAKKIYSLSTPANITYCAPPWFIVNCLLVHNVHFFNFQDMIMAWHVDESSRDPRELSICFFQNNIKLQILIFCVDQLFLNYFQDIKIQYQHM